MRIDVAAGVMKYMMIVLGVYFFTVLSSVIIAVLKFCPVTSGATGTVVILVFRVFMRSIHSVPNFETYRTVGTVLFLYITFCSKGLIILFMFKCKLLTNAMREWNSRLNRVLHKGMLLKIYNKTKVLIL